MYKNIVVPLDGSKLAELALPHVEEIAKGCGVQRVMLVSVTEKIKGMVQQGQAFEEFVPEKPTAAPMPVVERTQFNLVFSTHVEGIQEIPLTLGRMAKTAADYLCKVAEDLEKKGLNPVADVLMGNPAEQIACYAEEQGADLIIMAGTGKAGIGRWNMSNISNKVIKETTIPVLLVRPGPDFKETKSKRRGVAL